MSEACRSECWVDGWQWQRTAHFVGFACDTHRMLGLRKFPKSDVVVEVPNVGWLDAIPSYAHLLLFLVGSDRINDQ